MFWLADMYLFKINVLVHLYLINSKQTFLQLSFHRWAEGLRLCSECSETYSVCKLHQNLIMSRKWGKFCLDFNALFNKTSGFIFFLKYLKLHFFPVHSAHCRLHPPTKNQQQIWSFFLFVSLLLYITVCYYLIFTSCLMSAADALFEVCRQLQIQCIFWNQVGFGCYLIGGFGCSLPQ